MALGSSAYGNTAYGSTSTSGVKIDQIIERSLVWDTVKSETLVWTITHDKTLKL